MSILDLGYTILTVFLISIGQILFKYAAEHINIAEKGIFFGFLLLPTFILALFIYGVATLLWVYVLKSVPLTLAYPFMALVFIIVPCLAYIFLGEAIKLNMFIGAFIIIIGLVIAVK